MGQGCPRMLGGINHAEQRAHMGRQPAGIAHVPLGSRDVILPASVQCQRSPFQDEMKYKGSIKRNMHRQQPLKHCQAVTSSPANKLD